MSTPPDIAWSLIAHRQASYAYSTITRAATEHITASDTVLPVFNTLKLYRLAVVEAEDALHATKKALAEAEAYLT